MSSRLKKAGLILADLMLAAYIIMAFSAFNKPEEKLYVCKAVNIVVEDASTHGFIDAKEVERRLNKSGLYPKGKALSQVSTRKIEETLQKTPFVHKAECYKTQDGTVTVSITQRLPVVRIKAVNNDDFYIDDQDCIMPNSEYTSDLIIATGYISRDYAVKYVSPLARTLMADDLCRNLFEQINVTKGHGIELVPRLGGHVVYLGKIPESNIKQERQRIIEQFVNTKIQRLEAFYKYGLKEAGWNMYSEISLEFDNQIICKRIYNEE
ncbi:MAG: cell division protein FtsQ [Prevotellaceae bacterium]|nr:cell division protein FtsQ [Prevotellaceae bacterium]